MIIATELFQIFVLAFYVITLLKSISFKQPCRSLDHIINLTVHRRFCIISFCLLFSSCLARCFPWVYHVYVHHTSPISRGGSGGESSKLVVARHLIGVLAFSVVGLTRRGPLLRYNAPRLGAGFGISGSFYDGDLSETEPNVLDWQGSSMFAFATLFYVSLNCLFLRSAPSSKPPAGMRCLCWKLMP